MSIATASQTKSGTSTQPRKYTLNATHRCDRCSAQAYVHVFLTTGNDLLWCRHHWNAYESPMRAQELVDHVIDETDRLTHNRLKGSEN